jgi:hypothetical protein
VLRAIVYQHSRDFPGTAVFLVQRPIEPSTSRTGIPHSCPEIIATMPPPPADSFASLLFLAPALRAQPDRRLVALVREGYEAAFEEIVRRYRKPLDRFAASIVGGHSEDVTQDAFSKALLALRGSEAEIELRLWLYRIVRNTALNDLRDRPAAEQLGEAIPGGLSAAAEAERREEIAELRGGLTAALYAEFNDSHEWRFRWMLRVQRLVPRVPPRILGPAIRLMGSKRFIGWSFAHYLAIAPPEFAGDQPASAATPSLAATSETILSSPGR